MQSIILSRHDFREYDQIISAYTKEQGKKELLARGVKKIISKNSSYLEPGSLVDIDTIKGQEIDHLLRVQPINLFKNIRLNFQKNVMIYFIFKILRRLIVGQEKDEYIFNLLLSWLNFLEKTTLLSDAFIYSFLLKLYHALGFSPVLSNCVVKGEAITANTLYFSPSLGGVVCASCVKIIDKRREIIKEISQDEINELQKLLTESWEEIIIKKINSKTRELIEQLGKYHTEKHIFSWSHFKMNTASREAV